MNNDSGRSPDGSGYSAEPEPSFTVSAVPVSIPNAVADVHTALDELEAGIDKLGHGIDSLGTAIDDMNRSVVVWALVTFVAILLIVILAVELST